MGLIIAGAVAATGIGVGVLLLNDNGSSVITSKSEAEKLAADVTPRGEAWGAGFVEVDESYQLGETVMREDCVAVVRVNRPGTLGGVDRLAERPPLVAEASVRVFEDAATATAFLEEIEDWVHRCPAWRSGEFRHVDAREWAPAKFQGFDEVVSKEGRQVANAEGEKVNLVFASVTGQIGQAVLDTFVVGPPEQQKEIRRLSASALQRMQQRLAER